MSFKNLLTEIVQRNLCMSCGMCHVVCTYGLINIVDGKPVIDGVDKCKSCLMCTSVCPGYDTGTASIEKSILGRNRTDDERWLGIIRGLYGGHAIDDTVYKKSGSGGIVSTLLMVAFDYYGVDCVVVAGRDDELKWKAAPHACFDPNDIINFAQTTYQISPYLVILRKLFYENPSIKIGIVALPCQVEAIRKIQSMDGNLAERFRNNVKVIIEIACSTNTLPEGTKSLITDVAKVDISEVESVKYREGTYPGCFVVRTKNDEKSIPFWQSLKHYAKYKSYRCLSCPDWVSGVADISVWDGDPNIFAASKENGSKYTKHATIAVRTENGEGLLKFASEKDLIKIWTKDSVPENFGLLRKRNNRAQYERSGKKIPIGPIPGYREIIETVSDEELISK